MRSKRRDDLREDAGRFARDGSRGGVTRQGDDATTIGRPGWVRVELSRTAASAVGHAELGVMEKAKVLVLWEMDVVPGGCIWARSRHVACR